jgi:hypothetical protein
MSSEQFSPAALQYYGGDESLREADNLRLPVLW